MVKYEKHDNVLGETWIHAYSDSNRYIVTDGKQYGHCWFKESQALEFTEGDIIEEEG